MEAFRHRNDTHGLMAQEKQKQSANQGRGQEQLLNRLKDLPNEKTSQHKNRQY